MHKLSIIAMNLTLIKMILRKMSFPINDVFVTDNQIIANEFNNFFVLLAKQLASDLSSNMNPLIYLNSVVKCNVIPTITTQEVRNIISSTKKIVVLDGMIFLL